MKLQELYESMSIDFIKHAKQLEYRKTKAYKTTNGKSHSVLLFRKDFDVDGEMLTFEYTLNPETESWIFCVSTEDVPAVEIASGEDTETLVKHIKKKHKISKAQIEKYFK